jgi:DNA repair exonuclease SbcCD nuclease subunit
VDQDDLMLVAHLSDLHLGRASPGDPHGSERLISLRQAIVKLAALDPDVLVIAGDMFDAPDIDQAVVEEAARCLSLAKNDRGEGTPVIVIPGNHDPAEEIALWSTFRKSLEATSVSVVLEPEVISLKDGRLIVEAYPCLTRFSPGPPWDRRLSVPKDTAAVHVIVAHGTLQGGPVPEGETDAYPFTQSGVESLGVDYVALGHFHGVYPPWPTGEEIERSYCYSGTHEHDQFGSDAGYAVLAVIANGQPARLRRIKVGRRAWRLVDVAGPGDLARLEELRGEVAASEHPGRFVIRLRAVPGTSWPADKIEHFRRLEKALRTLGAHVETRGEIHTRVNATTLDLAALPSGAVKEALLSLQADIAATADESRREVLAGAVQLGWEKMQEAARA